VAEIDYYWTKTSEPIRISEFASDLGFNLRSLEYEGLESEKWDWIHSKIRNSIISYIEGCWENEGEKRSTDFSLIKQGIYVLTLADNLSIDYDEQASKVLYIGRGQIRGRLSAHIKKWIREFSESLQDISFDVWMTEIKVKGSKYAYKEVEADLINHFYEKYDCFPIQNSKTGDYHEKEHDYPREWNRPLNNPSNINNGWSIKPLRNNPWSMEFKD